MHMHAQWQDGVCDLSAMTISNVRMRIDTVHNTCVAQPNLLLAALFCCKLFSLSFLPSSQFQPACVLFASFSSSPYCTLSLLEALASAPCLCSLSLSRCWPPSSPAVCMGANNSTAVPNMFCFRAENVHDNIKHKRANNATRVALSPTMRNGHTNTPSNELPLNDQMWGSLTLPPYYWVQACTELVSYPGSRGRGKESLVSIACACA